MNEIAKSPMPPDFPKFGAHWFDTINGQLCIYTDDGWRRIVETPQRTEPDRIISEAEFDLLKSVLLAPEGNLVFCLTIRPNPDNPLEQQIFLYAEPPNNADPSKRIYSPVYRHIPFSYRNVRDNIQLLRNWKALMAIPHFKLTQSEEPKLAPTPEEPPRRTFNFE